MNKTSENLIFAIAGGAIGLVGGAVIKGASVLGVAGWLMFAVALMVVVALYRKFQSMDFGVDAEKEALQQHLNFYVDRVDEMVQISKRQIDLNQEVNALAKDELETNRKLYHNLKDLHVVVKELQQRAPDVNYDAVNEALSDTRYFFKERDGEQVLYIRMKEKE